MHECGDEVPQPRATPPSPAADPAAWPIDPAVRRAPLTFRDVPIMPFTAHVTRGPEGRALPQGGPLWPDWTGQTVARFCHAGRPVDLPPEPEPIEETIEEPIAWGGSICPHFGHQIADFSTRLLPTLDHRPGADFAFGTWPRMNITVPTEAPGFFLEILAWCGISVDRVRIITRPTLARDLLVAPQAEIRGVAGVSPRHLDMLDALTERHLGRPKRQGTVYVSRAGQAMRFAGEAEIERALVRAGVTTIRPESLPLREQLGTYAAADRLLFAEGSALHGLQLLGRGIGEVHVLRRRPAATFDLDLSFLEPRARRVVVHRYRPTTLRIHGPTGRVRYGKAMTVLDEGRLLAGFEELGIPLRRHWSSPRYRAACESDLRQWLGLNCTPEQLSIPGSAESIRTALDASGFGELRSVVDSIAHPAPTSAPPSPGFWKRVGTWLRRS